MAPRPRASVGVARDRVLVAARNVDHAATDERMGNGNVERRVNNQAERNNAVRPSSIFLTTWENVTDTRQDISKKSLLGEK
jgi:hypothetical protein